VLTLRESSLTCYLVLWRPGRAPAEDFYACKQIPLDDNVCCACYGSSMHNPENLVNSVRLRGCGAELSTISRFHESIRSTPFRKGSAYWVLGRLRALKHSIARSRNEHYIEFLDADVPERCEIHGDECGKYGAGKPTSGLDSIPSSLFTDEPEEPAQRYAQ
jgi:hypothetical protein